MKKFTTILIAFALIGFNTIAQTAYITNQGDSTVSVIDLIMDTIVATIHVGSCPIGVSVTNDGSKVYITNACNGPAYMINTFTNTISDTIAITGDIQSIVVSPDGSLLYIAHTNDSIVSVINTMTNAIIATVNVGYTPSGICISPDGNKIYVSITAPLNAYHHVIVINTTTNAVSDTIQVGNNPCGIFASPDGTKVYVACNDDSTVNVINTTSNIVSAIITVGAGPGCLTVTPDGSKVYVSNNQDSSVSVINTATNLVIATIAVGNTPQGVSVSPDGSKLCVANTLSNTISIINTATNTVTHTIPGGNGPTANGNFISVNGECSAQFMLYADTMQLHHYFIVNNAFGIGTLHYDWSWGDTTQHDSIPYPSHTYSDTGFYTICLTINDSLGCTSTFCDSSYHILRTTNTMAWVNVISPSQVGLIELNSNHKVSIFPNPATNLLTISLPDKNIKSCTINLYDMLGEKVIETIKTQSTKSTINLINLPQGIYFLEVLMDGEKVVKKVVKL